MYREHAPGAALAPWVECLWTSGAATAAGARARRVLPDGCVDVLFEIDGRGARGRVVGTMTTAIVVPPGTSSRWVAARLRPGAAERVLGAPADTFTDADAELARVWPDAARLEDALADDADADALARRLAGALAVRVRTAAEPDAMVREAVRRIDAAAGALRIDELARGLGVTRQHLARQFARHVGIGPKALARVVRLHELLRAAAADANPRWAALAIAAGYADQAHLAAEFRSLVGVTPSDYLAGG